jgi:hypothetical protein
MVHACARKFVEAFIPKKYIKKVDYNPIPTSDDIKVIKYNKDGKTEYDVSSTFAYGCGERYMLRNVMDEDVFLNYVLDGEYEESTLNDNLDYMEILKYEYARSKRMDSVCESILSTLCDNLTYEANEKGKAYALNK